MQRTIAMQIILTEEEYSNLKESANKAENYEKQYYELMSQHLALKDDYSKLLVFGVSSVNEKLKAYTYPTNKRGHEKC